MHKADHLANQCLTGSEVLIRPSFVKSLFRSRVYRRTNLRMIRRLCSCYLSKGHSRRMTKPHPISSQTIDEEESGDKRLAKSWRTQFAIGL